MGWEKGLLGGIWIIILLLVAGYGAACLSLYLNQERLLFYPSRDQVGTPADLGLRYEDVELTAADGTRLTGWFLPGRTGRVLLFFHGNGGNMTHRLDSLKIFSDLGLGILIIDYRGYGSSQGTVSEQGLYLDGDAAWQYLVKQRGLAPEDIVVFGRSLGAAVGARVAVERRPGALIVESGFSSVPDLGQELYPFFPVRLLVRYHFNAVAFLESVSCPVLVVHSPEDELAPFSHGRRLFGAVKGTKWFLEIRGGHNDGFLRSGSLYTNGLQDFLLVSAKDT